MKRAAVIAAAAGLIVALLALFVAPGPHRLGTAADGDATLADRVRQIAGDDARGYRGLQVAVVDRGRTSTATVGDTAGGRLFEIGSTTKAITGMLFAALVADGTVRPGDTLGATLPAVRFSDPGTASITLEELATHRAGLPRLAPGRLTLAKSSIATIAGRNPYAGEDVDALLAAAAEARVGDGRGRVAYSNFGMALLGQALAARTGVPYPQLVTERILRPLGMSETLLSAAGSDAGDLADGSTAAGLATDPWVSDGYAPAGVGPRSTAADMSRLVAGALAGTAPGAAATTPRFDDDDAGRIGYAWFTDRYGDREITWHNGGTGGFRSYLAFDRATQRGVVVLGNTDRPVEWIGLRLLGAEPPPGNPSGSPGLYRILGTIWLLLWAAVSLALLAVRPTGGGDGVGGGRGSGAAMTRRWLPGPDRLRVVSSLLTTVAVLLLLHRIGAWLVVPPLLWALAAGLAAAGAARLVVRWPALPTRAAGKAPSRWTETVLSAAFGVAVIVVLA